MTERSIYLVSEPLSHAGLTRARGSSQTSGSESSAVVISHWAIVISAKQRGDFDRYELFQVDGQIVVDCCNGGRRIRQMLCRRTRNIIASDLGRIQHDKENFDAHRPIGQTMKTHGDIIDIIRGNNSAIKEIWDGEYDLAKNNCQNFVLQILKLILSSPSPSYFRILLKQQQKVTPKIWAYSTTCEDDSVPPHKFEAEGGKIHGSYKFKNGVTQEKIDREKSDEFCPESARNTHWHPFIETALFTNVFSRNDGYYVANDKKVWGILCAKLMKDVSGQVITLEPEHFDQALSFARKMDIVPTFGLAVCYLLYVVAFYTGRFPFLYTNLGPWLTSQSDFFLGSTYLLLLAFCILTLVGGIRYNRKYQIEGLDGVMRIVLLLITSSSLAGIYLIFARAFECYATDVPICHFSPLLVHYRLLQDLVLISPKIRPLFRISVRIIGGIGSLWWILGCAFDPKSISGMGSPVYLKRGPLSFFGHWALVIDDREYHLFVDHGQAKFKDVLHKTGHLPDSHHFFTGKYFIGWATLDKTTLRERLLQIVLENGDYKFGKNDCRTFVVLACENILDKVMIGPSALIYPQLYLSIIVGNRSHWIFGLLFHVIEATLIHLSHHLMQTLTDEFPLIYESARFMFQNSIVTRTQLEYLKRHVVATVSRRKQ